MTLKDFVGMVRTVQVTDDEYGCAVSFGLVAERFEASYTPPRLYPWLARAVKHARSRATIPATAHHYGLFMRRIKHLEVALRAAYTLGGPEAMIELLEQKP